MPRPASCLHRNWASCTLHQRLNIAVGTGTEMAGMLVSSGMAGILAGTGWGLLCDGFFTKPERNGINKYDS